jgi:hypothetical protein
MSPQPPEDFRKPETQETGLRLTSDEDVEEILRLAVRKSGAASDTDLRDRLKQAAAELNISEEELRQAEIEFIQKREAVEAVSEAKKRDTQEFMGHLITFVAVNVFLISIDVLADGGISWSIYPLLGWGIGLAIKFVNTFIRPQDKE